MDSTVNSLKNLLSLLKVSVQYVCLFSESPTKSPAVGTHFVECILRGFKEIANFVPAARLRDLISLKIKGIKLYVQSLLFYHCHAGNDQRS